MTLIWQILICFNLYHCYKTIGPLGSDFQIKSQFNFNYDQLYKPGQSNHRSLLLSDLFSILLVKTVSYCYICPDLNLQLSLKYNGPAN